MAKPKARHTSLPRRAEPRVPFSDSLGKTLRRRRLDLGFRLEDIADETKIQKVYLKAIEQANYENLPHSVHSLGFVRRYARLLGLNSQTATTKYLLERGQIPSNPLASRPKTKLKKPVFGSRMAILSGLSVILITVVAYLLWQLRILAAPPQLTLNQPSANSVIAASSLVVSGHTTPGASVTINGQSVLVDDSGNFSATINLTTGLNQITVEAKNSRGQISRAVRNVIVGTNY